MKQTSLFSFDKKSLASFTALCEVTIQNVLRGTKKATTEACEEILEMSLAQVPRDTDTLAKSAYYKVERRTELAASSYYYRGIIGYGGNGDPINPKNGKPASAYMVRVHEDLTMWHFQGKAKFLEDAVNEYGEKRFNQVFQKNILQALRASSR